MISIGDSEDDWDSEDELEIVVTKQNNGQDAVSEEDIRQQTRDYFDLDDLQLAATRGNLNKVQQLLDSGFDVNTEFKSGWTLVMYASEGAQPEVLEYCVSQGADVNYHYQMFYPLMALCNEHSDPDKVLECTRILLAAKAQVNVHDKHHTSTLMLASQRGLTDTVKLLCQQSVDYNKQDRKGWTALMWAASEDHRACVDVLLAAGASAFLKAFDGQDCADIAYSCGHQALYELLEVKINPSKHSLLPPKAATTENHTREADVELFLTSIDLGNLIPLFREQHIEFSTLTTMSSKDLERIGVIQLGVQKKILEATKAVNSSEWEMPDQSALYQLHLNCKDAAKVLKIFTKHLKYLNATATYVLNEFKHSPKMAKEYDTGAVEDSEIIGHCQNVGKIGATLNSSIIQCGEVLSDKIRCPVMERKVEDGVGSGLVVFTSLVVGVGIGVLGVVAGVRLKFISIH